MSKLDDILAEVADVAALEILQERIASGEPVTDATTGQPIGLRAGAIDEAIKKALAVHVEDALKGYVLAATGRLEVVSGGGKVLPMGGDATS